MQQRRRPRSGSEHLPQQDTSRWTWVWTLCFKVRNNRHSLTRLHPDTIINAGIGHTVLSFSLLCAQTESWAWNTLRTRRRKNRLKKKRVEASSEILWVKKKNCLWLWNITRKKCVVAFCHFLFLFDDMLMMLSFLRINIFTVTFYFNDLSLRMLFFFFLLLFLCCNMFDFFFLLCLFTPFHKSIGRNKKKEKKVQYCPNLWSPNQTLVLLPVCPQCSRQEIWR